MFREPSSAASSKRVAEHPLEISLEETAGKLHTLLDKLDDWSRTSSRPLSDEMEQKMRVLVKQMLFLANPELVPVDDTTRATYVWNFMDRNRRELAEGDPSMIQAVRRKIETVFEGISPESTEEADAAEEEPGYEDVDIESIPPEEPEALEEESNPHIHFENIRREIETMDEQSRALRDGVEQSASQLRFLQSQLEKISDLVNSNQVTVEMAREMEAEAESLGREINEALAEAMHIDRDRNKLLGEYAPYQEYLNKLAQSRENRDLLTLNQDGLQRISDSLRGLSEEYTRVSGEEQNAYATREEARHQLYASNYPLGMLDQQIRYYSPNPAAAAHVADLQRQYNLLKPGIVQDFAMKDRIYQNTIRRKAALESKRSALLTEYQTLSAEAASRAWEQTQREQGLTQYEPYLANIAQAQKRARNAG